MRFSDAKELNRDNLQRIRNLFEIIPNFGESALEIGARHDVITKEIARKFKTVFALDIITPETKIINVDKIQGDLIQLPFEDNCVDIVICTEVLEHIPTMSLKCACNELSRVAKKYIIIGVPYKQDLREGKTSCSNCGKTNPPWNHFNSFSESSLLKLFPQETAIRIEFIGKAKNGTNILSEKLMDLAGNPWGSYHYENKCPYCGFRLASPPSQVFIQKIVSKLGVLITSVQKKFIQEKPKWIHVVLKKA
jgi:hypothetical protein